MYSAMQSTYFSVSWYFVTFNVIVVIIILKYELAKTSTSLMQKSSLLIALVIDTFVLQHEILRSQQDILLEIPDTENKGMRKSRFAIIY